METLYRFFALDALFQTRRYPISTDTLLTELNCSKSTLKRLLATLREQFRYPIKYCRQRQGYYYDRTGKVQATGLWFNAAELQALLTIQQLLGQFQPGLLEEHFNEFTNLINKLLAAMGKTPENTARRLRIIPIAHQQTDAKIFLPLSQAVLHGQVATISYQDIRGQYSERQISPQRLVYYRDHWYLDAWCHLRQALRIFWVAGIKSIEICDEPAQFIGSDILDNQLKLSYGIFVGEPDQTAHLRFTGLAAMRTLGAQWHPDQRQLVVEDGSLELWVPYSDHRELTMDILRYGSEVEVLEPESLRVEVIRRLKMTLNLYEKLPEAQSVSFGVDIL